MVQPRRVQLCGVVGNCVLLNISIIISCRLNAPKRNGRIQFLGLYISDNDSAR